MIACKKCGFQNLDGSLQCSQCGAALEPEWPSITEKYCARCKGALHPGAVKCPLCGFPVTPEPTPVLDPKPVPEDISDPVPPIKRKKTLYMIGFFLLAALAFLVFGRGGTARPDPEAQSDTDLSSRSSVILESQSVSDISSSSSVIDAIPMETTEFQGVYGFEAVPLSVVDELPSSIDGGEWDSKRKIQGIEWKTDTMDRFYICYASYIVSYDAQGKYKAISKDVGGSYLFSLDYYNGKLFSVIRTKHYEKLSLVIFDPDTLEQQKTVELVDIEEQFLSDKERYGEKILASIDAVAIAPQIGGGSEEKIYVSYNCYKDKGDGLGLNEMQQIFEYNYKNGTSKKRVRAERTFRLDLGRIQYGIQTLEYDRTDGNLWCAVRQGKSDYSLYCIDSKSKGNVLSLVTNGSRLGWDCPSAGDGICSLGNDWYYLLIPDYHNDSVTSRIQKVERAQLE